MTPDVAGSKPGYAPPKRCVIAGCSNETDGFSTCCAEHNRPAKMKEAVPA